MQIGNLHLEVIVLDTKVFFLKFYLPEEESLKFVLNTVFNNIQLYLEGRGCDQVQAWTTPRSSRNWANTEVMNILNLERDI
jgi:hypothetical protein